jgi:GTP:adenosylcobinamide-phosphate guanylyltransferase
VSQLELDDPGIVTDVDTIRDLAQAQRLLSVLSKPSPKLLSQ